MSGLFLVEQKAIVTITEEQNLMATFMDAVSTIPNLLQSTTSTSYHKMRQLIRSAAEHTSAKNFSYNPSITLKKTTAKSVKIAFSSIRCNELAWLYR